LATKIDELKGQKLNGAGGAERWRGRERLKAVNHRLMPNG